MITIKQEEGICDWCEQKFKLQSKDYIGMFTLCHNCKKKQERKQLK